MAARKKAATKNDETATEEKPATNDGKVRRIRRISVATTYGKVNVRELPEDGTPIPILRAYGLVSGTKEGEGDYGPFCAFLGTFEAENLSSGQRFRAAKLFLPNEAEEMVQGSLASANGGKVKIGFDIEVSYDADASTKYVYHVTPLVDEGEGDVLREMAESLPPRK